MRFTVEDTQGRKLAFRSYQSLKEQEIAVRAEYYDQVYLITALPHDTVESIWKRLSLKTSKNFKGYHSLSISDVLVCKGGFVGKILTSVVNLFIDVMQVSFSVFDSTPCLR